MVGSDSECEDSSYELGVQVWEDLGDELAGCRQIGGRLVVRRLGRRCGRGRLRISGETPDGEVFVHGHDPARYLGDVITTFLDGSGTSY